MASDSPTVRIVTGYRDGQPFALRVLEVECGHYLDAALCAQAREAIRVAREDGMHVSIESAFRSNEEQRALHDGWLARKPGFKPADLPTFSKHQEGCAIDLAFATADERERFAALAVAHGFARPHPREPWHFVVSPLPPELS